MQQIQEPEHIPPTQPVLLHSFPFYERSQLHIIIPDYKDLSCWDRTKWEALGKCRAYSVI